MIGVVLAGSAGTSVRTRSSWRWVRHLRRAE